MSKKPPGTPFVILGMHRSGTSLVAGILHSVGVSMGSELLEADEFNPYGYFEDKDFLSLNKDILEEAGGSWYNPPEEVAISIAGKKFNSRLQDVITSKRKKAGRNNWGWKDPRNCITYRLYAKSVPDAKFVVVVRNPKDIKKSLLNSHGDLADWDRIIQYYFNSIDRFLQLCRGQSMTISFEELVHKKYSQAALSRLLIFVGKSERASNIAVRNIHFR